MNQYNYNIPRVNPSMQYSRPGKDDRFVGGLFAPLLLGGLTGYAIGHNRPCCYPQQMMPYYGNAYYPTNTYYNNAYYRPY